jgi:hypothetical protein
MVVSVSQWIKFSLLGLFSIPVILALLGALSFYFPTESPVPEDKRLLRQLQKDYVSYIQENTNLVCTSIGSTGLDPIEGFLFYFRCPERVEQREIHKARKIALNCSEALLSMINSNEALKPYLVQHPFNNKNIELSIIFSHNKNPASQETPLLGVSIDDLGITYMVKGSKEYELVDVKTETYREAIRLAKLEDASL